MDGKDITVSHVFYSNDRGQTWSADWIGAHTWNAAASYISGAHSLKVGYQGAFHVDNRAPFGDTTLTLPGDVGVGAISSITSAFIAQLLTIEVSRRIERDKDRRRLREFVDKNRPKGAGFIVRGHLLRTSMQAV